MSAAVEPAEELLRYLTLLTSRTSSRDQRLDVRWALPGGDMAMRLLPLGRIEYAARLLTRLAAHTDVYVGVAPRQSGRGGGKSAIEGARFLYIECDHDPHDAELALSEEPARLSTFPFLPTIEVASGTPGHLHLYWALSEPASAGEIESANRRLARELAGDPVCVDVARVLRPPGTLNHKHDPPRPVRLLAARPEAIYTLAQITGVLPPDPRPKPRLPGTRTHRRAARGWLERELDAISPVEYVTVLTGRTPNRAGKVLCPFHEETKPSLQLYADGHVHCYGCGWHGWLIDFAAALKGVSTRGADFLELRAELAAKFGIANARRALRTSNDAR